MKVKELIEELKTCDPESIVVLSIDEEGNGYNLLYQVDDSHNYSDGEIGLREITKVDEKQGYSEEDILEGEKAVVLWP